MQYFLLLSFGLLVSFFVYSVILRISARILNIGVISLGQCLILFVVPPILTKTITMFIKLMFLQPSLVFSLISLIVYFSVEIGVIRWITYGLSMFKTVAFVIVTKIVAVLLIALLVTIYQKMGGTIIPLEESILFKLY
jgi:hypothetical protein